MWELQLADTPLVGLDVALRRGTAVLPTDATFEHAVAPLEGSVRVGDQIVEPGWLALIPQGIDELPIEARDDGARLLLLGGAPLGEPIQMWWNFVARDKAELEQAWRDWQDRTERFAAVDTRLDRIEAPRPPWVAAGA